MQHSSLKFLAPILMGGLLLLSACAGANIQTEDIQGLLQAMQGKEMVITLDDGSTIRITVEDSGSATTAQQMVGQQVNVQVRIRDNERQLDDIERIGEDEHFTGVIQSMNSENWTIGGKIFRVDANTQLDGGLAVGVTARVEFVTHADGVLRATEIETDAEDEKFKGSVQSMGTDTWIVGGQTFKVNAATRIDRGLAAGAPVRVHFITQPDGSLLAVKIESDQPQNHFAGVIQSIGNESWTVGGRIFKVNAATRLDDGLAVGVKARVEFITLSDGTNLATEISTDEAEDRFFGTVNQTGTAAWVVDGQSFNVTAMTRIDPVLTVGSKVVVRFTTLADGTKLATRIQADNSGRGNQTQFRGTIESVSANTWVISGRAFTANTATRIDEGLIIGSKVRVRFNTLANGSMLALRIEEDKSGSSSGEAENDEDEDEKRDGEVKTPPLIPHTLEGRADCLACHGPSGFRPFPADHAGRTNDVCRTCHQPSS